MGIEKCLGQTLSFFQLLIKELEFFGGGEKDILALISTHKRKIRKVAHSIVRETLRPFMTIITSDKPLEKKLEEIIKADLKIGMISITSDVENYMREIKSPQKASHKSVYKVNFKAFLPDYYNDFPPTLQNIEKIVQLTELDNPSEQDILEITTNGPKDFLSGSVIGPIVNNSIMCFKNEFFEKQGFDSPILDWYPIDIKDNRISPIFDSIILVKA